MILNLDKDEYYPFRTLNEQSSGFKDKQVKVTPKFYAKYKLVMKQFDSMQQQLKKLEDKQW